MLKPGLGGSREVGRGHLRRTSTDTRRSGQWQSTLIGTFRNKRLGHEGYQHERAHSYEHSYTVFDFKSASLFQSLITAATIGIFVGSVGVALNAVWLYRQTSWHVTATVQGLVQMLIVTVLVTIVLEQRRKRAIRRTLGLAFLNHHVRNALTQMSMVSYIADPEKREHLLQDAAARVSEVLFRIANSADLTGLSLEVDLAYRF